MKASLVILCKHIQSLIIGSKKKVKKRGNHLLMIPKGGKGLYKDGRSGKARKKRVSQCSGTF